VLSHGFLISFFLGWANHTNGGHLTSGRQAPAVEDHQRP